MTIPVLEVVMEVTRRKRSDEKDVRSEQQRQAGPLQSVQPLIPSTPLFVFITNCRAGEALVLSENQQASTSTRFAFIKNSPAYQRWLETYEESDSPFISALRTVTTTVGGWFDENETAQVIRSMKEIDPDFKLEKWTGELREYIVPEVVDAYLSADRESLRQWCGEAVRLRQCLDTALTSDVQRVVGNNGPVHQTGPDF
jgi:hypothetical protein